MNSQTAQAISNVVNAYTTPAGMAPAVQNIASQGLDSIAALQNTVAVLEGFAGMMGTSAPFLGAVISAGGLANDIRNISNGLENGTISNSDALSALGNASSTLGGIALSVDSVHFEEKL